LPTNLIHPICTGNKIPLYPIREALTRPGGARGITVRLASAAPSGSCLDPLLHGVFVREFAQILNDGKGYNQALQPFQDIGIL